MGTAETEIVELVYDFLTGDQKQGRAANEVASSETPPETNNRAVFHLSSQTTVPQVKAFALRSAARQGEAWGRQRSLRRLAAS